MTWPIWPLSHPEVTITRSPVKIFHLLMSLFEHALTCLVTCFAERRNAEAEDDADMTMFYSPKNQSRAEM